MAVHSRILAWRIPWTEEPDGPEKGCKAGNIQHVPRIAVIPNPTHDPGTTSGADNDLVGKVTDFNIAL